MAKAEGYLTEQRRRTGTGSSLQTLEHSLIDFERDASTPFTHGIASLHLTIEIKAGRDLKACDGIRGTSDPFVRVFRRYRTGFANFPGGDIALFKSKVVVRTLNPEWNHTELVNITENHLLNKPENTELLFTVWDKDMISKSDPMGECVVPIAALLQGRALDDWVDVQNCEGCANAKGSLHLAVQAKIVLKDPQ